MIDYLRRCVEALGSDDDRYFVSVPAAVLNAVNKRKKICFKLLLKLVEYSVVCGQVYLSPSGALLVKQNTMNTANRMRNSTQPKGLMAFTKLCPAVMILPPKT